MTKREEFIRERFYWYECGICSDPKIRHSINFSWTIEVFGNKFPAELYSHCVAKPLRANVRMIHPKHKFNSKNIRRER